MEDEATLKKKNQAIDNQSFRFKDYYGLNTNLIS